jgi:transposase
MGRFVEGADRSQLCLLPECLDDWVREDNPVHVIEVFVEALDLGALGFAGGRRPRRVAQPITLPVC